jgi:RNA polymerase sigma-70 factor (ECF subfamily)
VTDNPDAGAPERGGEPSSSLLSKVRAGAPAGWQRLVELYGPLVYQWCRRAGLQPTDARDVGQEVFAAVYRGIGEFRRERPQESFRAWLRVVTHHKIIDHRRRQRNAAVGEGGSEGQHRLQQVPGSDGLPSDDDAEVETEVVQLLRRALDAVKIDFQELTWKAFLRVEMDRAKASVVAEELNMTVNAVRLARARVLRRLREELGDLEAL